MKIEIGARNCLYPLPVTLVGALVDGTPNYLTAAHVGIMDPGCVSLGLNKAHFTNPGIKANGTFSVNIPSVAMVRAADYCGLVSGKTEPKDSVFKTFYGNLRTAPMIEECSLNMECELVKTVDFPNHDIFIGRVAATYCDESILADGVVDLERLEPILFAMHDRSYWKIGGRLARAFDVGKNFVRAAEDRL